MTKQIANSMLLYSLYRSNELSKSTLLQQVDEQLIGAIDVDSRKVVAIIEGEKLDGGEAIGEVEGSQLRTRFESPHVDCCDALWKLNRGQVIAIHEGSAKDRLYAIGDRVTAIGQARGAANELSHHFIIQDPIQ